MAENGVTKEQLEKGNEPAFGQTLAGAIDRRAARGAGGGEVPQGRGERAGRRASSRRKGALAEGLGDMHGARGTARSARSAGQQTGTKTKDAGRAAARSPTRSTGSRPRPAPTSRPSSGRWRPRPRRIFGDGLTAAETAYERHVRGGKGRRRHVADHLGRRLGGADRELARARRGASTCARSTSRSTRWPTASTPSSKPRRSASPTGRTQVETFVDGLDAERAGVRRGGARQRSRPTSTRWTPRSTQRRDALVDNLTTQYKASYERMSAMEEELRERQQVAVAARLRRHGRPDQEDPRLQGHAARASWRRRPASSPTSSPTRSGSSATSSRA